MMAGAQNVQSAQPDVTAKAPPAAQVDLSTKSQEIAKAQNAQAQAEKGIKFPSTEQALRTKANQSAAGTITGAFVAGPNQPWSPNWVFGSEASKAQAALSEGKESPLAALQALMEGKGGDATQAFRNASPTNSGASAPAKAALNTMSVQELEQALKQADASIAALSPMSGLVPVDADAAAEQVRAPQAMTGLSGAEYLSALESAKPVTGGQARGGDLGGQGFGGSLNGQSNEGMAQALSPAKAKGALPANGGELSFINGSGLSTGKPLVSKKPGLEEGRLNPELTLGASVHNLMQGPKNSGLMKPNVITGHVVPGSMMRERLTNESLSNMTSSISGMSVSGGGEMRIKLNPGNLGELMIRVSTDGNHVGLKVQASDSGAKKILEESISSLKDSLAGQNLSLGRVDISVAQPASQSAHADANGQNSWQAGQQSQMGQSSLQDGSQGGSSGRFSNEESAGLTAGERSRQTGSVSNAFARQARATGPTGRLDVMA